MDGQLVPIDPEIERMISISKDEQVVLQSQMALMNMRTDVVLKNSIILATKCETMLDLLEKLEKKKAEIGLTEVFHSPIPKNNAVAHPDLPAPTLNHSKTISSIAQMVQSTQEQTTRKATKTTTTRKATTTTRKPTKTTTNARRSARLKKKRLSS